MTISPRKLEVEALTEILESDAFDSSADMAKALLKRTFELFQQRPWFTYVHREQPGALVLMYGPMSTAREAEKVAQAASLGGDNYTFKMFPVAALTERSAAGPRKGYCTCSHRRELHEHPKQQGKCIAGHMAGKKWVTDCPCKTFTEET